jgi:hypothetical protein
LYEAYVIGLPTDATSDALWGDRVDESVDQGAGDTIISLYANSEVRFQSVSDVCLSTGVR